MCGGSVSAADFVDVILAELAKRQTGCVVPDLNHLLPHHICSHNNTTQHNTATDK